MEGKPQGHCGLGSFLAVVVGFFCIVITTSFLTIVIAQNFYSESFCGPVKAGNHHVLQFSKEKPEWEENVRIRIEEMGVEVVKTESEKCFVMPLRPSTEEANAAKGRPLVLIQELTSEQLVLELAGPDAVQFCAGSPTYLFGELTEERDLEMRKKRQALENRESGLELEYDQRTPRCMDLLLDCASTVGQVQSCYTWVNGIIKMNQQCESPTRFTIYMAKPRGRILKIAIAQSKICAARRAQLKRC